MESNDLKTLKSPGQNQPADPFDSLRPDFVPKPELPTYSESGVDLSLLRWMLSLSYKQRLEMLQNYAGAPVEEKHGEVDPVRDDIPRSSEAQR